MIKLVLTHGETVFINPHYILSVSWEEADKVTRIELRGGKVIYTDEYYLYVVEDIDPTTHGVSRQSDFDDAPERKYE